MKLSEQDNETIAHAFPGGEHVFFFQDLEDEQYDDARHWLCQGVLVGLVSEVNGGIIGYIHRDHAEDIATILNIHAVKRDLLPE